VFVCAWVTACVLVFFFLVYCFLCCLSAVLANKRTHIAYIMKKLTHVAEFFDDVALQSVLIAQKTHHFIIDVHLRSNSLLQTTLT